VKWEHYFPKPLTPTIFASFQQEKEKKVPQINCILFCRPAKILEFVNKSNWEFFALSEVARLPPTQYPLSAKKKMHYPNC
jgi:hypothetical protein